MGLPKTGVSFRCASGDQLRQTTISGTCDIFPSSSIRKQPVASWYWLAAVDLLSSPHCIKCWCSPKYFNPRIIALPAYPQIWPPFIIYGWAQYHPVLTRSLLPLVLSLSPTLLISHIVRKRMFMRVLHWINFTGGYQTTFPERNRPIKWSHL